MPQLVAHTVNASQVSKGDLIREADANGPVTKIDKKQKFAYIYVGDDTRPFRIAMDSPVRIERSEATEAEKEETLRQYRLHALDRAERSAVEDLKIAQDKLRGDMDKGYKIDYSRLDDLLRAQAQHEVWSRVTHLAKIQAERAVAFGHESGTWMVRSDAEVAAEQDGTPPMDRLAVAEYMVTKITEELLQWTQFTSRSTSVMSNAVEDYSREAKARFTSRLYRGW